MVGDRPGNLRCPRLRFRAGGRRIYCSADCREELSQGSAPTSSRNVPDAGIAIIAVGHRKRLFGRFLLDLPGPGGRRLLAADRLPASHPQDDARSLGIGCGRSRRRRGSRRRADPPARGPCFRVGGAGILQPFSPGSEVAPAGTPERLRASLERAPGRRHAAGEAGAGPAGNRVSL